MNHRQERWPRIGNIKLDARACLLTGRLRRTCGTSSETGRHPCDGCYTACPRTACSSSSEDPPCQHLTCCGSGRGIPGVCGRDSYLFYAVPITAWLAERLRPGVLVQVMNENAGSMRDEHRLTMRSALGVRAKRAASQVVNPAAWTAFTRNRTLISTLPTAPTTTPPRRPCPWEEG